MNKQISLFLILFFFCLTIQRHYGQTNEITNFLNNCIKLEQKAIKKKNKKIRREMGEYDPESLKRQIHVVTPYTIEADTLYVAFKYFEPKENMEVIEKQKVAVQDLRSISYDGHLFIDSNPKLVFVETTFYYEDGTTSTRPSTDVFLSVPFAFALKDKEVFANEIIEAFRKEGVHLERNYWP
jgi:hypothetical protein